MTILATMRPSALAILQTGFGRSGLWLLGCIAAWLVWVLASALITGQSLSPWSPHVVAPIVLALGALTGIWLAQCWAHKKHTVPVMVVLAVSSHAAPIYANASAAVGALLLALAFMAYAGVQQDSELEGNSRLEDAIMQEERQANHRILAVGIGVVGFLMGFGSQAVLALIVPLLLLSLLAIRLNPGLPRWLVVGVGIFLAEMAAIAVLTLGLRD